MRGNKNILKELEQKVINQENKIAHLESELSIKENKIAHLESELSIKEKKISSFPQLSATSLGQDTSDGKIRVRNWFVHGLDDDEEFCNNLWFSKFLRHHFPNHGYKIHLFFFFF